MLRVEWCKARARAFRWSEEVLLLLEEMRRVVAYHTWHARWWDDLSYVREDLSAPCEEGYAAYAFRQASIRRALSGNCSLLWRNVPAFVAGLIEATEL